MIDTHAHLTDSDFDPDREEVIKRAKEAGVEKILCILIEFDARGIEVFKKLLEQDFIFGAVGVHPHDAKDFEKYREKFLELLGLPKVIAVGEIGLDYHYMNSPLTEPTSAAEVQQEVFKKQLEIAKGRNLPAIIHCREAFPDYLSILKNSRVQEGIAHCFSGSENEAKEFLEMGFYISFAGPVTFKNAVNPKELIKKIPEDRLLLETDCPYLAPQTFRGKRNEPAYIKYIYEEVANLRNISEDKLKETISKNVFQVFRI